MASILKYKTSTGYGKEYFIGNTPDFTAPINENSFLINPNVSAVILIPVKYWKVVSGIIYEMNQTEKTAIDDFDDDQQSIRDYPIYSFMPHNTYVCDSADWASNGAASIINDPANSALNVFKFTNATETGVGFSFIIPVGIRRIYLNIWWKSASAPGAEKNIKTRLYCRNILDGSAIGVWNQNGLDDTSAFNDTIYHCTQLSKKISNLGCTGGTLTQFEFTRRGAQDTLGVDMLVNRIIVKFK